MWEAHAGAIHCHLPEAEAASPFKDREQGWGSGGDGGAGGVRGTCSFRWRGTEHKREASGDLPPTHRSVSGQGHLTQGPLDSPSFHVFSPGG